jgi:hypothetical protein
MRKMLKQNRMTQESDKAFRDPGYSPASQMEGRVRLLHTPSCDICDGQTGSGTGFVSEYFSSPVSALFHQCSIVIYHRRYVA